MQPNWLGAFAAYAAVQALEGKDVPAFVKVPLPIIDNSNIDEYLARAKDFPADGYIYSPYDQALFDEAAGRASSIAGRRRTSVDGVRRSLAARGVSKSFFGNPVLRDVSIALLPGRVHALLGENGAGKSTLINLLSGALAPDGGTIEIDGRAVAKLTPPRRAAPASPSSSRS